MKASCFWVGMRLSKRKYLKYWCCTHVLICVVVSVDIHDWDRCVLSLLLLLLLLLWLSLLLLSLLLLLCLCMDCLFCVVGGGRGGGDDNSNVL